MPTEAQLLPSAGVSLVRMRGRLFPASFLLIFLLSSTAMVCPGRAQSQQTEPAAQNSENPAKPPELPPAIDAKEIVRRAIEVDHRDYELARSYTCANREVVKHLGKHGEVKSTEIKTYDLNFYYGDFYPELVQIDDKPLSDKEKKKEDEKLEKFLAKRRNESPEERQKRLDKEKKEREEGRAFVRDVVNAYDFRIVGEEQVGGTDTWIIEATPRKDFHPTQPHADMLKKIRGRMWIEKNEYNWVKVEAETTDTISFGLFLFRIHAGSRFMLEKTHLNNEVWLLRRLTINGGARLALFKNEAIDQDDEFTNYKKFVTSVRIIPRTGETQPQEQPKEQPKQ